MKQAPRSFTRLRPGDVIEIPLSKCRTAYAQFVGIYPRKPRWGALIRVLDGIFTARPLDLAELVLTKERFYTFFPAGAAVTKRLVQIVANEEIPPRCRKFPLFKAYNENFDTNVRTWWLWDGRRSWRVGALSPEHYDLPLQECITFGLLVERIKKGWTPRDEVKPVKQRRK